MVKHRLSYKPYIWMDAKLILSLSDRMVPIFKAVNLKYDSEPCFTWNAIILILWMPEMFLIIAEVNPKV